MIDRTELAAYAEAGFVYAFITEVRPGDSIVVDRFSEGVVEVEVTQVRRAPDTFAAGKEIVHAVGVRRDGLPWKGAYGDCFTCLVRSALAVDHG